jgi:peptidoglycan/LPS O-acetylase OafA/YrhL
MRRDYANLDALRATAVILVLVSHIVMASGHLDDPLMEAWGIRDLAQMGVLMFFIHTSLVLMMSIERLKGQPHDVFRFYIRRVFRIYPLAVLTVLVALLFEIPPHFEPVFPKPTTAAIWQNVFLVQNLFQSPDIMGPMWSLPLEVQMYALLPLLYVVANRVHSYFGAASLIIAGFALWYFDSHSSRLFGHQPLFHYAPWFFMGIAAFSLYRFVAPRLSVFVYGLCLLLLVASPCVIHRVMGNDYRAGWISWITGIGFTFALPHFVELRSLMVKRVIHTIATYSYGIYLCHVPILWLAFQQLSEHSRFTQIVIFTVLVGSVPPAMFHFVEKPLIGLGARISDRLARPSPETASPSLA